MAVINQTGISATSLTEYKADIEALLKSVFGDNFNVDPEEPQGQLIGQLALTFSLSDDAIIDMFNATDIYTAEGSQMDFIASNINVIRNEAQNTEVICDFTGVAGTIIPEGETAEDTNGNKFTLKEAVTIGVSGTVSGTMVSVDSGALVVDADTLTKIVSVIAGWETINNPTVGITGYSEESDSEFLKKYLDSVAINSVSQITSMRSSLLAITDVKQAIVVQNDEKVEQTIKGLVLPPNSITSIALGGTSEDIINAIGQKKPVGIPTNGTTSGEYTNEDYYISIPINYYIAEEVEIEINLDISTFSSFPSDGIDVIKSNIVNYFDGTFEVSPGYVTEGSKIGSDVIYSRIYTPINQVIGHEVNSYTIGIKGETLSASDVSINLNQIAAITSDDIAITVT